MPRMKKGLRSPRPTISLFARCYRDDRIRQQEYDAHPAFHAHLAMNLRRRICEQFRYVQDKNSAHRKGDDETYREQS